MAASKDGDAAVKPTTSVDSTSVDAKETPAAAEAPAKKDNGAAQKLLEKFKSKDLKGGAARYSCKTLAHACAMTDVYQVEQNTLCAVAYVRGMRVLNVTFAFDFFCSLEEIAYNTPRTQRVLTTLFGYLGCIANWRTSRWTRLVTAALGQKVIICTSGWRQLWGPRALHTKGGCFSSTFHSPRSIPLSRPRYAWLAFANGGLAGAACAA